MDCGANDELMDASGFGGGGLGADLRGEADVDGRRSPGFGETGRTNGSGFEAVAIEEEEAPPPLVVAAAAAAVAGAEPVAGAGSFIGGGGIIPLP